MASVLTALETLTLELTNPTTSNTLTKFHPFPKLPIELRLKIWRLLFPGPRVVCLDMHDLYAAQECHEAMKHALQEPLPLTLYVNNESREETLRHYTVLYRPSSLLNTKTTFCIDPEIDMVYVCCKSFEGHHYLCLKEWLTYFDASDPGLLKKIQMLEVREMPVTHPNLGFLFALWGVLTVKGSWMANLCEALGCFDNLKEVCFTDREPAKTIHIAQPQHLKDFEKRIRAFLEAHKAKLPGGKMPKVTVRHWQPIAQQDDEQRNEHGEEHLVDKVGEQGQ